MNADRMMPIVAGVWVLAAAVVYGLKQLWGDTLFIGYLSQAYIILLVAGITIQALRLVRALQQRGGPR